MKRLAQYRVWLVWLGASGLLAAWLAYALQTPGQQASFMPGKVTHAHHQIELKCAACHAEPFKGRAGIQEACLSCHAKELKAMDDSHPVSKFTDPRNADTLAKLDARQCVSCHFEHKSEITRPVGVTLPDDFCVRCHSDIEKERPSHKGMVFTGCATGGCHNFHDNRALYEDFLIRHGQGGKLKDDPKLPERHLRDFMVYMEYLDGEPITASDMDGRAELRPLPQVVKEWEHTAHAKSGVNCSACHQAKDESDTLAWIKQPDHTACTNCHKEEVEGFLTGLHGMRLKQGLSPMQPGMAEQPMKPSAAHAKLTCMSCHGAHRFDTRKAAVEACLNCHDDGHTRAYKASPHFSLWHEEISGRGAKGQRRVMRHLPSAARRNHHAGRRTTRAGAAQPERQPAPQRKDGAQRVHELPRPAVQPRRAGRRHACRAQLQGHAGQTGRKHPHGARSREARDRAQVCRRSG